MHNQQNKIYEFGRFQLDPVRERLTRDGMPLSPPVQSLLMLRTLIENAGRVVETSELATLAWPDGDIAEGQVDSEVRELRKLLEDRSPDKPLVRPIPGKGYRFEAPVEELLGDIPGDKTIARGEAPDAALENKSPQRWGLMAGVAASAMVVTTLAVWGWQFFHTGGGSGGTSSPQVAVLPFQCMSGNPEDEKFTKSVSVAVINQLNKNGQTTVLPVEAVEQFGSASAGTSPVDIGRDLHLRVIVNGMVQRLGGHAWVNIQVVSAEDGRQLWTGGIDGNSSDVQGLAVHIAGKITRALPAKESAEEP